jgi:phytoene dehydrogenase-like protein
MYRLAEPIMVGPQKVELLGLRIFNYSPYFAPAGKTVIQPSFETEWDYWNELQKDRPHYEAEKERVAAEVLRRLEAHYPGLSSQVEVTDVATPYTTWRYTLNWKGAYEGWLPTGPQLMTSLPRTLPGLANFYMAGQWVMPGGGVPTCLISGRDAVRIMCKRDGKAFVASGLERGA